MIALIKLLIFFALIVIGLFVVFSLVQKDMSKAAKEREEKEKAEKSDRQLKSGWDG